MCNLKQAPECVFDMSLCSQSHLQSLSRVCVCVCVCDLNTGKRLQMKMFLCLFMVYESFSHVAYKLFGNFEK